MLDYKKIEYRHYRYMDNFSGQKDNKSVSSRVGTSSHTAKPLIAEWVELDGLGGVSGYSIGV